MPQSITRRLLDRVDEEIKADVAYWAAFYDHRLRQGNKPIFHLEGQSLQSGRQKTLEKKQYDTSMLMRSHSTGVAFVAKIMMIHKRESHNHIEVLLECPGADFSLMRQQSN